MTPVTGPTNTPNTATINLSARMLWSKRRAWPGETVKMLLSTELVKDDAAVEVVVLTPGDAQVDKVTGKKVTSNAMSEDYKIAWKDKNFGEAREFKLGAKIGDHLQAAQSPVMYIDLDKPLFSA